MHTQKFDLWLTPSPEQAAVWEVLLSMCTDVMYLYTLNMRETSTLKIMLMRMFPHSACFHPHESI